MGGRSIVSSVSILIKIVDKKKKKWGSSDVCFDVEISESL